MFSSSPKFELLPRQAQMKFNSLIGTLHFCESREGCEGCEGKVKRGLRIEDRGWQEFLLEGSILHFPFSFFLRCLASVAGHFLNFCLRLWRCKCAGHYRA